jgi:riboflavin synthase
MFTGIIENLAQVTQLTHEVGNIHVTLRCPFTNELKVDQSVAHNGICLTVVAIIDDTYTVTAIQETIQKTSLGNWEIGTKVNVERCMQLNGRLDGHIVQGHVDTVASLVRIEEENGSWKFTFEYDATHVTVEKGSITVNGVSLTVVDSTLNSFSVYIIPFTYEHTNFHQLKVGDKVNLEFDIIGKYVARLLEKQ